MRYYQNPALFLKCKKGKLKKPCRRVSRLRIGDDERMGGRRMLQVAAVDRKL